MGRVSGQLNSMRLLQTINISRNVVRPTRPTPGGINPLRAQHVKLRQKRLLCLFHEPVDEVLLFMIDEGWVYSYNFGEAIVLTPLLPTRTLKHNQARPPIAPLEHACQSTGESESV